MAEDGATRVGLVVDRKGWRILATVNAACLGMVVVGVGAGSSLAYGPVQGVGMAVFSLIVLSPLAWLARFASKSATAEAWIEVSSMGPLTVHHPIFLSRDLVIDRDVIHSYFVGELSGDPPPLKSDVSTKGPLRRLGSYSRTLDERSAWRPAVAPSGAAPDLVGSAVSKRWNFVLVFARSYSLARTPRRALAMANLVSRGYIGSRAPQRHYWIRGFFGLVEDPNAASAVLDMAGFVRTELTLEVLAWLGDAPPVPVGRAWRNYWRDRKRTEPGPSDANPGV